MWILIVLLIFVILAELYLLAHLCRHGHPYWQILGAFRYAHRGYHDKPTIPENSMAAFRRAAENLYGAELDVHLMADGNLAVIHDASLKRTAGADVFIEDLTAEDLVQYRLEGTEERIPLLEDVLALFESKTPLIVELKPERGNHAELAAAAVALLDRYRVNYCIESFDPRCLLWLKKHRPDIVRGQLCENFLRHGDGAPQGRLTLWALGNLLLNFLTRPDFIAYRYEDRRCGAVRICRRLFRVQEINWTITTREEMRDAENLGNLVIFERFDPRG